MQTLSLIFSWGPRMSGPAARGEGMAGRGTCVTPAMHSQVDSWGWVRGVMGEAWTPGAGTWPLLNLEQEGPKGGGPCGQKCPDQASTRSGCRG